MKVKRRFQVTFGEAAEAPTVYVVPTNKEDTLLRTMALLEELESAGFLPEEFQGEYRALATAYHQP